MSEQQTTRGEGTGLGNLLNAAKLVLSAQRGDAGAEAGAELVFEPDWETSTHTIPAGTSPVPGARRAELQFWEPFPPPDWAAPSASAANPALPGEHQGERHREEIQPPLSSSDHDISPRTC